MAKRKKISARRSNLQKYGHLQGRQYALIITTLVITFFLFSPTLDNSFLNYDDQIYVTENPLIINLSGDNLKGICSQPVAGNYHPVTILSLAVNFQMTGWDASSYIWTNILLHLLNTTLVFVFLFRLFHKNFMIGLIGAFLFAVHPMHVESVAWVSERKDVLYTAFLLGGLIAYLRYLKERSWKILFWVFILFGLSCLSKPAAVIFPLLLLLLDYFRGRNMRRAKVFVEKIPFFLISVIIGLLTISFQREEAIGDFQNYSILERIIFASYGWSVYLIKAIIPYNLSAMHPYPILDDGLGVLYYLSPLLVIGIFAWAIWKRSQWPVVLTGLLFYTINLLLVLQFVSVGRAIIAERYTYVPYIGIFMIIGWGTDYLLNNPKATRAAGQLAAASLVLLSVYFALRTYKQSDVWQNSESLWSNVIEEYPDDWYAYMGLANHYRDNDQLEQALNNYNEAIERKPGRADLYDTRGNLYRRAQKYNLALQDLNKAVRMNSNKAEYYNDRGTLYFDMGRDEEALQDFRRALQIKPDLYQTYSNMGSVYGRQQKFDLALEYFSRAIEIESTYPDAYLYRGIALSMQNRHQEAIKDLTQYMRLIPSPAAKSYYWRSNSYFHTNAVSHAIEDITTALQLNPQSGQYYLKRSDYLAASGLQSQALQDALRAKELGVNVTQEHLNRLKQ